jgi:hypothetical protein
MRSAALLRPKRGKFAAACAVVSSGSILQPGFGVLQNEEKAQGMP